jgi:hypothetical protein
MSTLQQDIHRADFYTFRFATSIILEMTYGYSIKANQDELVTLVHEVMHNADKAGRQGAYLADLIPQRMLHVSKTAL